MKNVHLRIRGKVQGVGFRYSAKSMARSFGLKGYVKNLHDESVYIEVEGDDNLVDEFITWCHKGPDRAVVDKVIVEKGEIKNFIGFDTQFS